jgi:hypothetical protein
MSSINFYMNFNKLFILIITLLCLQSSHADTSTIVLQNVSGGYNGCEDSYTFTEQLDTNYSTGIDFLIFNCVP